jgi:hypothetical protein
MTYSTCKYITAYVDRMVYVTFPSLLHSLKRSRLPSLIFPHHPLMVSQLGRLRQPASARCQHTD